MNIRNINVIVKESFKAYRFDESHERVEIAAHE